jgi:hypothetical protein
VVYDVSHAIPRNEMIKESVGWMEKYWGRLSTAVGSDEASGGGRPRVQPRIGPAVTSADRTIWHTWLWISCILNRTFVAVVCSTIRWPRSANPRDAFHDVIVVMFA